MSSLHREVMLVLLGDITGGTFAEGERLPTLTGLAAQFEVSTGVIRECQRALAERGVVSVRHGRRAIVTPEQDWDVFDPDVLTALVSSNRATHVLTEYLEARRLLEVEAAGLAAERATPVAVQRLTAAFDSMRTAAERARTNPAAEPLYEQADIDFHRAIIRAAGNRPLARMAEPIHRALTATFAALARPQTRFERGLPEHGRILEAITGGDSAAARLAMREHLLTVEGYLHERTAAAELDGGATVAG
ncbi:MAG: GntR family transcriptional regulator, transcriptional repressor for pyruvate dehydrogenase complex [Thermoleophilaceae bacterium]|jgi:GntR family transcriptional repressor for pyruvate dehydrogenase complex|nr:GntR family transcriptional regulator, transcriptional repressor for pyruvate dehydrogenase complex [Thermoleophilaceae bacterium]MEA2453864.1 GntR family transcriptional regulator, transcriptional repressor for pyruvate dehydrogenase complex [Thermoleophilaceae bacterium]